MPTPRTEAQKLSKAPISVTLGIEKYEIKLLTIGKNMKWRQQVTESLGTILASWDQTSVSPGLFAGALTAALVQFPEKMLELIFAYAPDLNQEKIMEEATDEQISDAFSEIMQVAYPFFSQLNVIRDLVMQDLQVKARSI